MRLSSTSLGNLQHEELWHACAGPLVTLPAIGSRVVYFPQGHIEQVTALPDKVFDALPSYPSLPPQLVSQLHDVTMHADEETDEVYARMTLQTLSPEQNEVYSNNVGAEAVGITRSKQPTNYFHKTLTASDTSTHGCCSIPRRAAEKVFPPLDFGQEPPSQELVAKDLHGNEWKFRHTFRGQPKRHLLTIGWTLFVNAKRLVAGDSVIFIWYGYNELLLGIRRANRHQRLISGDQNNGTHVGLVAAHAAATNSPFTITYFPRASPSEFVIPLARYVKAVLHTRLFVGMRFRMLFETPESGVRRYMGKVVGIGDVEPVQWPNSHWRSVKVCWDEPTVGEKQFRVSPWEIEPLTTFPMYPSPFPNLPIKHQWPPAPAAAGLIPSSHSRNGQRDDNIDDDGISLTCSQVMMCFQNSANYNLGLQSDNNNLTMQQRFQSLQSPEINPTLMASSSSGVDEKRMASSNTSVNKLGLQPLQFQQHQTENNTSSSRSATVLLQSDQTNNTLQSQRSFFGIVQVQENSFVEQQQQQAQAAAISAVLPPILLSNYPDFGGPSSIISPATRTPPQPAAVPDPTTLYALPATLTNSSFAVDLGLLNAASPLECLPPPPLGVCVNPEVVDSAPGREQFVAKNNSERFFF